MRLKITILFGVFMMFMVAPAAMATTITIPDTTLVQVWLVRHSLIAIVAAIAVILTESDSSPFAGDSLSL